MDSWNAEQWAERFLWSAHLEEAVADLDCHLYRFRLSYWAVTIVLVFSIPEPKAYVRIYGTSEEEPRYRRNDSLLLTPGQVSSFLALLERLDFWNLSVEEEVEEDMRYMDIFPILDGEDWIIEGVRNGCYYQIHRDSLNKGVVFELGNAFWDLASMFHYRFRSKGADAVQ